MAGVVQRTHRTEAQALARAEQVRASAALGLVGDLEEVLLYEEVAGAPVLRHRIQLSAEGEGVSVRYEQLSAAQRTAEFLSTKPVSVPKTN